jgi:hypothetical protein
MCAHWGMRDKPLKLIDLRSAPARGLRPAEPGAPTAALPCQNSNKNPKTAHSGAASELPVLTGGKARMAFVTAREIEGLVEEFGVTRCGFVTLTFKWNCCSRPRAERLFRNFAKHELVERYLFGIVDAERQARGAWHFHLFVVCKGWLGTAREAGQAEWAQKLWEEGERMESRRILRKFVGPTLRAEWAWLRKVSARYGFGRSQILPVKSTAEAVSRYVCKYIQKGDVNGRLEDKGRRRVRFMGWKRNGTAARVRSARQYFGWATDGGRRWRIAVSQFAMEHRCRNSDDLKRKFGKRWCYRFRGLLLGRSERQDPERYFPPWSGGCIIHTEGRGIGIQRAPSLSPLDST